MAEVSTKMNNPKIVARLNDAKRHVVYYITHNKIMSIVVLLAILQGLWYAISFQPSIYDEGRHFENIQIYAKHMSPFLGEQQVAWDHLGAISRDGSYMFYYLMSWPLRFLELISDDVIVQVIGLRIINMAFFLGALFVFRKALLEIKGFSKPIVDSGLLLVVLTPAAGLMAGIINYDNLVLLLFAFVLLLGVRSVKSRVMRVDQLALLIIIGSLMSVVKWSSIALLLPVVAYVAYDTARKHKWGVIKEAKSSYEGVSIRVRALLLVGLVAGGLLFIERPLINTFLYGKPSPSCGQVISSDRCMSFPDYRIYSNVRANKSPDFNPVEVMQYIPVYWLPTISNTMTNTLERGDKTQLPITTLLYKLMILGSLIIFLVALRDIIRDKTRVMLIVVIIGYLAFLLLDEYTGYIRNGMVVAVRARYVVPIMPLYITLTLFATWLLFGRYRRFLLASSVVTILLLTQGGGIVTYLMTTPEGLYWRGSVRDINRNAKHLLEPVIKQ